MAACRCGVCGVVVVVTMSEWDACGPLLLSGGAWVSLVGVVGVGVGVIVLLVVVDAHAVVLVAFVVVMVVWLVAVSHPAVPLPDG